MSDISCTQILTQITKQILMGFSNYSSGYGRIILELLRPPRIGLGWPARVDLGLELECVNTTKARSAELGEKWEGFSYW
jgi:hypothetical protein